MKFNTYKLKVTSDLYIKHYNITAQNLKDANKQARIKFGKQFKQMGQNVKVSLDPEDLPNHIEEIISYIYN